MKIEALLHRVCDDLGEKAISPEDAKKAVSFVLAHQTLPPSYGAVKPETEKGIHEILEDLQIFGLDPAKAKMFASEVLRTGRIPDEYREWVRLNEDDRVAAFEQQDSARREFMEEGLTI